MKEHLQRWETFIYPHMCPSLYIKAFSRLPDVTTFIDKGFLSLQKLSFSFITEGICGSPITI
jgi:hypothetical protein